MKTTYLFRFALTAVFVLVWAGCGSDSAGTTFIPSFNATWPVVGDGDHQIDLQPDQANQKVHSGVFEGEELHASDEAKNNNPLSGSFKGLDIEFTIQRANENVRYTGKMTPISETDHTIIRFDLHSSEGNLVLGF